MTLLIVGEPGDPHVDAVVARLKWRGKQALVADIDSLIEEGLTIDVSGIRIGTGGVQCSLDGVELAWLRRLHRAGWASGIRANSLEAVELGVWHSAYTWAIDAISPQWLTAPADLRRGESKLQQWRVATALRIPYPRTLVTTDPREVAASFTGEVVVKPLGAGQYISELGTKNVYATLMGADDSRLNHLRSVPFIVQARVRARAHLRVVTVGHRSWTAALVVAPDAGVDWRSESANHSNFQPLTHTPTVVHRDAIAITLKLGLGFSSQDWIETDEGEYFLVDVNPAGQWLFLPSVVSEPVTDAIAAFLAGES